MGNPSLINKSILVGSLALTLSFFSGQSFAANKILEQLEGGAVVSGKTGSTILVQALVKEDAAVVMKALTEDLKDLPKIAPQIAFARPYTMNQRNLVYLKLRGAGDGVGVVMEMKEGPREAFAGARAFLKSGDTSAFREASKEELNEVGDLGLASGLAEANSRGETERLIGTDSVVLLEGPLNDVIQMPHLRMTVQLSVAPYTVRPAATGIPGAPIPQSKNYSLFQVKAALGRQAVIGRDLGDYLGLRDQQVELAKGVAENVVKSIRARLESR